MKYAIRDRNYSNSYLRHCLEPDRWTTDIGQSAKFITLNEAIDYYEQYCLQMVRERASVVSIEFISIEDIISVINKICVVAV